ncbi:MAG: DUF814 domain-containing protein [Gemmatimonadetes bacterium]|nr:DUF814 domain-containing protein [Gemmatimonadota bacterium]MYG22140.1 DUF814 domain-containing protein [Gemmatimonadota bacterium]MYJ40311.1 DUF814 domain-containing protein [Gemmatimonadota bacterium]
MIWDPCLARAVAAELRARLSGARARAVSFHREARVVQVDFRDATLEVDLGPGRGVIVVGPPSEPDADAEPLPAVLAEVGAVRDERVIVMRFRRVRGRKPQPSLIVELATNRWNVVFAEGPEARVRRRLGIVRSRPHPVGQPWFPPGEGIGAAARTRVDLGGWRRLVEGTTPREARLALLQRVEYLSGLNVGHVLAAPDPEEGFRRWLAMAEAVDVAPHILHLPSGPQPYPWPLPGTGAESAGSLLGAMAAVREAAGPDARVEHGRLGRHLARESRRLSRKLKHLRREMGETARAARLREDGALILSSLHLIRRGAERVSLTGFDGVERALDLDPRVRPQEHADALFRRAARLERAAEALPGRIAEAEEALAGVAALRARHQAGELSREEAVALLPAAAPSPPRRRRSRPGTERSTLPYRRYTSSGGIEIRVGRGARHNDALTFRHSRPEDVWMHARHAAGAHVIMRWTRPERPPAADLNEAAVLAANHSGARGSRHVPVDWTRRKWVRKPRGAPPGAVIPDRVQTVFATPDPSLGDRLGRPRRAPS